MIKPVAKGPCPEPVREIGDVVYFLSRQQGNIVESYISGIHIRHLAKVGAAQDHERMIAYQVEEEDGQLTWMDPEDIYSTAADLTGNLASRIVKTTEDQP